MPPLPDPAGLRRGRSAPACSLTESVLWRRFCREVGLTRFLRFDGLLFTVVPALKLDELRKPSQIPAVDSIATRQRLQASGGYANESPPGDSKSPAFRRVLAHPARLSRSRCVPLGSAPGRHPRSTPFDPQPPSTPHGRCDPGHP